MKRFIGLLVLGVGLVCLAQDRVRPKRVQEAKSQQERETVGIPELNEVSDPPDGRITSTEELAALIYGDEPVPVLDLQEGDAPEGVPLTPDKLKEMGLSFLSYIPSDRDALTFSEIENAVLTEENAEDVDTVDADLGGTAAAECWTSIECVGGICAPKCNGGDCSTFWTAKQCNWVTRTNPDGSTSTTCECVANPYK